MTPRERALAYMDEEYTYSYPNLTAKQMETLAKAFEEAEEAGRSKGMDEARKVAGAPLSERHIQAMKDAFKEPMPKVIPSYEARNLLDHIDYLSSVIALMTNDSDAFHQGRVHGMVEAKEIVDKAAVDSSTSIPDSRGLYMAVGIIEQRIKEIQSVEA